MTKIKSGFSGERAVILPSTVVDEFKVSNLGKNLYITDIGYYPSADFHYRQRNALEANQYILMYCVEGEGWFRLNDEVNKVVANQLIILPKSKSHTYGSSNKRPWTIYWIHFDGDSAGYFSEGMDKPLNITPDENSRINERLRLFEEIFTTLRNGYSKQNLELSSSAFSYFLCSVKHLQAFRNAATYQKNSSEKDITENAIHYMRENIHKKLTVKSIADFVGLSASHFSAVFQTKTEYSPLNFLTHLRIQGACHYLDFSDIKINQLSSLVGYDDPLYFSRIFTKTMGCSPTKYRNKKKG